MLSTSHLTRASIEVNGFGPVHAEGYGIAYNIHAGHVRAAATTYLPRMGGKFATCLEQALGVVGLLLRQLAAQKERTK